MPMQHPPPAFPLIIISKVKSRSTPSNPPSIRVIGYCTRGNTTSYPSAIQPMIHHRRGALLERRTSKRGVVPVVCACACAHIYTVWSGIIAKTPHVMGCGDSFSRMSVLPGRSKPGDDDSHRPPFGRGKLGLKKKKRGRAVVCLGLWH